MWNPPIGRCVGLKCRLLPYTRFGPVFATLLTNGFGLMGPMCHTRTCRPVLFEGNIVELWTGTTAPYPGISETAMKKETSSATRSTDQSMFSHTILLTFLKILQAKTLWYCYKTSNIDILFVTLHRYLNLSFQPRNQLWVPLSAFPLLYEFASIHCLTLFHTFICLLCSTCEPACVF